MLLVDVYNVLHTPGVLPPRLAGLEVHDLLRLIRRSRHAGRRITLVCDGHASNGRAGSEVSDGATIRFSGSLQEADAVIEEMLATASAARTWLVVSSDRRVQKAARRVRAAVLDSRTFLEQLVADESHRRRDGLPPFATEVPLDRYAVAHWLEEFGLDPGPALEAPAQAPTQASTRSAEAAPSAKSPASPLSKPSGASLASRAKSIPSPSPRSPGPVEPIPIWDPVLVRAAQDPRERLVLGELDMRRWLPPETPRAGEQGSKGAAPRQTDRDETERKG
ncbi:MAG: NYN domain-containing protein [Planctomycetota bacterium]|nr:NYN domain-containing protein [Planctomycetota bacterium]